LRLRLKMSGSQYGKGKDDFKGLLKKHGLFWKGTMMKPWWGSDKERVMAEFERDTERDVTISATLTWVGDGDGETQFIAELRSWADGLGLKLEPLADDTEEGNEDIFFWDLVHRPQEKELQARGCPDRWIELEVEQWKRDRSKRMRCGPQ
jgi:hypothetical protein